MIYLSEDIVGMMKQYPNIPEDKFRELIALDPTYGGRDKLGKYGKWILNLYNKGSLTDSDLSDVTPLLNQFSTYRNRVENTDLFAYKSLDELAEVLASVVEDDSMLTDRQKLRFMKRVKSGKIATRKDEDFDVVYDDGRFTIAVPNTHEASMRLGAGTAWCTAHEDPKWYNHYTSNDGKLYIITDKYSGKMWQYSDETQDFMDMDDNEADATDMGTDANPEFYKFLNELDPDVFPEIRNEDGFIIVNDTITGYDKLYFDGVEDILIPKSVDGIDYRAFADSDFRYIGIPDSVKRIHTGAFVRCTKLESIRLPRHGGYDTISDGTFSMCESLDNIFIPDNVETIGTNAFYNNTSLKSVSGCAYVKNVLTRAFDGCSSLKNINLPKCALVDRKAFNDCTSLETVKLGGVSFIDHFAFIGCSNLKKVVIIIAPNRRGNIQDAAFSECGDVTVYSDNEYVIDWCNSHNVPIRPLSEA